MGTSTSIRWRGRAFDGPAGESGQALILALGGVFVLLAGALALVAIAGAVTGKGRVQRAADLAAISAARSMRDDLPRLLAPPALPNGLSNPAHIDKLAYLVEHGRPPWRPAGQTASLQIAWTSAFPTSAPSRRCGRRRSSSPGSRSARVAARSKRRRSPKLPLRLARSAAVRPMAEGGGYSGPLVYRDGEGMRPDVAAAFDRMSAAARHAGIDLVVVSGFRSDAEQAELFARHPDPRWVAPPGHSLHRCATELDLGPSSAYGWLAANARRFGFVQRYSWEAWHFGFAAGPPPCSQAGNALSPDGQAAGAASDGALPSFVPAQYREALLRSPPRAGTSRPDCSPRS